MLAPGDVMDETWGWGEDGAGRWVAWSLSCSGSGGWWAGVGLAVAPVARGASALTAAAGRSGSPPRRGRGRRSGHIARVRGRGRAGGEGGDEGGGRGAEGGGGLGGGVG